MKQMCPKLAEFFVEQCFAGWTPLTPVSVGPPKNVWEDQQFWCQIYSEILNVTTKKSNKNVLNLKFSHCFSLLVFVLSQKSVHLLQQWKHSCTVGCKSSYICVLRKLFFLSYLSDRCLYSEASSFHSFCLFNFFFFGNVNTTTPLLHPRCLFILAHLIEEGGGGCYLRGWCLFNLAKMMVSVCHKELEHKVNKLKCKKLEVMQPKILNKCELLAINKPYRSVMIN